MESKLQSQDGVNLKLVLECAGAFSRATDLPCTVSSEDGAIVGQFGAGYPQCRICDLAGKSKALCYQKHAYGIRQAQRFGGRYIYFCEGGLTCFASPSMDPRGGFTAVTAGPFLMVGAEEFVDYELAGRLQLSIPALEEIRDEAEKLAFVQPERVESFFILLFMSLSFTSNVWEASHLMETENSLRIQSRISDYISQLKKAENEKEYPFQTEKKILQNILDYDRDKAAMHLNELLGYILFSSGGDIEWIKTRVTELLVLISRSAIEAGTPPEYALQKNKTYIKEMNGITGMEGLCNWLTRVLHQYMDTTFSFNDVQHVDVIHKSLQYIHQHYFEKITLESAAQRVHLSPSYFSKIFKKEMGSNFNAYLNKQRIEKSKKLLLEDEYTLIEIAMIVGFEDHSYFTKVFKKNTSVTPSQYRKTKDRGKNNTLPE